MKHFFVAAALLLSTSAFARSPGPGFHKVLPTVIVNNAASELTGVLDIDRIKQQITVALYYDICHTLVPPPPGTIQCRAMPMLKQTLTVPIQAIEDAGCGSVLLKGKVDQRPVDGALTDIKVLDHSNRVCLDVVKGEVIVKAKVQAAFERKATRYQMY